MVLVIVAMLYPLLRALAGLALGLKMPNLTWTNETTPIKQSGCVMLRFENYCAQPVEMGADGLPVHNAHGGYDLQGVQAAAQRHDGTMTLHWADGWFTLRILLPVPEK